MKITKKILKKRYRSVDSEKKTGFKSWIRENGKEIVQYYKDKSTGDLDFSDDAMKLMENFI